MLGKKREKEHPMAPTLLAPSNFPLGLLLIADNCDPDDKVSLAYVSCRGYRRRHRRAITEGRETSQTGK